MSVINRFQDTVIYGSLTQKDLITTKGITTSIADTKLLRNLTVGGQIINNYGIDSTSTTTGSIITSGGIGCAQTINCNEIDTQVIKYKSNAYDLSLLALKTSIPTSLLGLNNTWTGTNNFAGGLSQNGVAYKLSNFALASSIPQSLLGLSNSWSGVNNFTGISQYGISYDLSQFLVSIPTAPSLIAQANTWTGMNNFTGGISQNSIAYDLSTLALKTGIPTIPTRLLGLNNTFTGINTFNTNLPTSTITPTTIYQLTNKNYTDTNFQSKLLSTTNITVNNLTLSGNIVSGINTITPTILSCLTGLTTNVNSVLSVIGDNVSALQGSWTSMTLAPSSAILYCASLSTDDLTLSNNIISGTTSITPTILSYLANIGSDVQFQLSDIRDAIITLTNNTPIGTIIMSMSAYVPGGFLLCNGQLITKLMYPGLCATLGTAFNVAGTNATTSCNVPNFAGAFLRGAGGTGTHIAAAKGVAQQDAIINHTHSFPTFVASLNMNSYGSSLGTQNTCVGANNNSTGATGGLSSTYTSATETRPYNYSVYYYIKC